jgi:hypothetical protein
MISSLCEIVSTYSRELVGFGWDVIEERDERRGDGV